jgi:hypothetical protein
MSILRDHVADLERDIVLQIIRDYEQFERDGAIGDCHLRSIAHDLIKSITKSTDTGSIVFWMERLAFEAYRRIAMEVISGKH